MRNPIHAALIAAFSMGCTPDVMLGVEVEQPSSVTKAFSIEQDLTVGEVRTMITNTVYGAYGYEICYGSETATTILSGVDATLELAESGIVATTNAMADYVIDEFANDSDLTAVHVEVTKSSVVYHFLWVPDEHADGLGYLFELVKPADEEEICVHCIDEVGQLSGSGCHCSSFTRTECGSNPSVSCTSECQYCPNGGLDQVLVAKELCGTYTPFQTTTLYSAKGAGSSL